MERIPSYQHNRNQHGMRRRDFLWKTLGATMFMATTTWGQAPAVIKGSTHAMRSSAPPCGPLDGTIIDAMETVGDWHIGTGGGATAEPLKAVPGYSGQALQLTYDLDVTPGAYAQLRRDFDPPLNLSSGDHIRFFYQGTTPNTLEIGLVSADGNYFGSSWNTVTRTPCDPPRWTYATWDFQDFRKDCQPFPDFSQVKAIFISVVNKNQDDVGGKGSFTVDELQYLNIAARPVPRKFERVRANPRVIQRAAAWIAAQQQASGLLRSWLEDTQDFAWLYEQALGLIVLSETNLPKAMQLASKLHVLQNADGSWYAGYHYLTGTPIEMTQPVGAIAWMVYALTRYCLKSGDLVACQDAREGAEWLANLQRSNGSLPGEPGDSGAPTEANLDAWWAFHGTGHQAQADLLQTFLDQVWDSKMGRFRSGPDCPNDYQIFLDNQTWGAAFLRAVGRDSDARRALSYAEWTLATTSCDKSICGFDGAGPFSVWNEGTLQYVAARGQHSRYYWGQMAKQQAADGGLPGSPDEFRGYIVWLTTWHGVAPTSWLYFAGTGGPFHV